MTTQTTQAQPNQMHIVDDQQRAHFLAYHFDRLALEFEQALISMARRCIVGYKGLYWEMATGNLNLPIIYPRDPDTLLVQTVFESDSRTVPSVLAGIYVSTLAILSLLQREHSLEMTEQEHDQLCLLHRELLDFGRDLAAHTRCANDWFALVD